MQNLVASEYQLYFLNAEFKFDGTACESGLGVKYRPLEDSIKATVDSMLDTGFVKVKNRYSRERVGE